MNATIDLEQEIVRANTATLQDEQTHLDAQAKLDHEIAKVQDAVASAYKAGIMDELGFDYQTAEARRIRSERTDFAALPQNRIMSTNAIKAVCLKYGLRFLPTRFYKGALDTGIGPAVEKTKALLNGKLPLVREPEFIQELYERKPGAQDGAQFAIAAPSAAFALQPRPVDPLLFLRLNSLKWFLVHKWGDDLKTGDVRKGEIGEHNWNSTFSNETVNRMDVFRMASMQQFMGSSASNPLSFNDTTGALNGISWIQATSSGSSGNNGIFNSIF